MKNRKRTFVECKDRIAYTEEMSDEDAGKCWKAILRFQNGLEVGELPYAVKIVFKHIMNFFLEQDESYKEILEKRSEAGKKGGRPSKEKTKKAKAFYRKQTKTNENKQKLTDTVTDTDTEIISEEIINNSNELLEANNNNTSLLNINNDEKIFGNEEINLIIQMISEINEGAMDGSIAKNRQFAKHLLSKIKNMPKVIEGKIAWQDTLKLIISLIKDDPYHANKLTSPENIYRNRGTLVSLARTKFQEQLKRKSDLNDGVF